MEMQLLLINKQFGNFAFKILSCQRKSLHFIEQIIEETFNGFEQDKLRFRFRLNLVVCT
jgi:hypothetical protein